jgi:hypothetical protein
MLVALAALTVFLGTRYLGATAPTPCSGAGLWTVSTVTGDTWTTLNTPLDNTKKRMGMTFHPVTFDATFGGLFPGATITAFPGIAEMVEYNVFDFTSLGYGIAPDRTILYILRGSGSFWFTDCDTVESTSSLGIYSPGQDPFGEDPPAYGCYPNETVTERVPIVPPCMP